MKHNFCPTSRLRRLFQKLPGGEVAGKSQGSAPGAKVDLHTNFNPTCREDIAIATAALGQMLDGRGIDGHQQLVSLTNQTTAFFKPQHEQPGRALQTLLESSP